MNLLDETNIDHIDMKLANILARLNTISEKKVLIDEQDKQSKVREKKRNKIKNYFVYFISVKLESRIQLFKFSTRGGTLHFLFLKSK